MKQEILNQIIEVAEIAVTASDIKSKKVRINKVHVLLTNRGLNLERSTIEKIYKLVEARHKLRLLSSGL